MLRHRPKGNTTQPTHDRTRLCLLFAPPPGMSRCEWIPILLTEFVVAHAFLREFRRLGIDPLKSLLTWTSGSFSVQRFIRIITTTNSSAHNAPSMHQAMYGAPEVSLHVHNWFTEDDAWHVALSLEVARWQEWDIAMGTQVQLVLFLSVFNGFDVMDAIHACTTAEQLPIRPSQLYIEQHASVERYLHELIRAGKNPFSLRFRGKLHNACSHGATAPAIAAIQKELKKLITYDEAISLAYCLSYTAKLNLLSARKGFSDDPDTSFVGKNLCNTLSALGKEHKWLHQHIIHNCDDHPDGPGAIAYYDLLPENASPYERRTYFIRETRRLWPTDVRVDGVPHEAMHLGHDCTREVTHETMQFVACALSRMTHYLLTGVILHHLKRTAVLILEAPARATAYRALLKRPASACKKPAAFKKYTHVKNCQPLGESADSLLPTFCWLLAAHCWLLGCSGSLLVATCCENGGLVGKSTGWVLKVYKWRKNDVKMTPKWMQNDSKMSSGGAWSALWKPRWASSLFLTFFDAILETNFGCFGICFWIKKNAKINANNDAGKVTKILLKVTKF